MKIKIICPKIQHRRLLRYCITDRTAWQTGEPIKDCSTAQEKSSGFGFQQNWVGILVLPLTSGILFNLCLYIHFWIMGTIKSNFWSYLEDQRGAFRNGSYSFQWHYATRCAFPATSASSILVTCEGHTGHGTYWLIYTHSYCFIITQGQHSQQIRTRCH